MARIPDGEASSPLDVRVRALVTAGDTIRAATEALRALGPEVLGFLVGVLGSDADADEAFAATSERLWRSLSTFEWRCSLRTWMYVIARREAERFRRGAQRHVRGRVSASELDEVVARVTTRSRSALRSERRSAVARLRDELPEDDRAILVLRVDRGLAWDEIALAFLDDPNSSSDQARRREAARVRKRFQLIKERLAARARAEGLV
jgi:RNA polymerase sigma-70 factor (ECF subfamily)